MKNRLRALEIEQNCMKTKQKIKCLKVAISDSAGLDFRKDYLKSFRSSISKTGSSLRLPKTLKQCHHKRAIPLSEFPKNHSK